MRNERLHPLKQYGIVAVFFLLLAGIALRDDYPPLPSPLRLDAMFDPAIPGRSDPIITAGVPGAGDFLYVKFIDATTAIFGYDSWGSGGPISKPVTLRPGIPHRLQIEAPMLSQYRNGLATPSNRLRVTCDSVEVLDAGVRFYNREPNRIFIGWNPIGGTACGQDLHGILTRNGGHPMRGGPAGIFSWWERAASWWTYSRWRIWPLLLLSFVVSYGWNKSIRSSWKSRVLKSDWLRNIWREHGWFVAIAAICLLSFAFVVTDGSFRFDYPENFGSFYDFQARSLLQGHLDVPPETISGEAFVVAGKYYGYFGLTPALLRIPFVALGCMVNNLSRGFMLFDYGLCLISSYLLLCQFTRMLGTDNSVPTPWATTLLMANVGLGSTLFFLSSRAYIYHEAILCAVAFALVSCFFTLRYFVEPRRQWWLGALASGLLCIQARPSTGLFVLSFTAFVSLTKIGQAYLSRRRSTRSPRDATRAPFPYRHVFVGVGCVLAIFSFNAVSYLKFKTFDGSPFKYHVQFDATRLNRIEGRNFHLSNLRFNFAAYLIRATFEFRSAFPFIFYTGRDPAGYRGPVNGVSYYPDPDQAAFSAIKMDMAEPMLGLPYAMSGLFLLTIVGTTSVCLGRSSTCWLLGALWAAVFPFALAMFMAVATAHRYTADFCPFLITASALGLATIEIGHWRPAARTVLATVTIWSIVVTLALTVHYQGAEVWGVPDSVRPNYQNFCRQISGMLERKGR